MPWFSATMRLQTFVAATLVSLAFVSLVIGAMFEFHPQSASSGPSIPPSPSISSALVGTVEQNRLTLSLFPAPSLSSGQIVPVTQFNLSSKDNLRLASFTNFSDRSSLHTYYQSDGLAKSYAKAFYPPQEGEICIRPKNLVIYDANGVDVHSEEWYRLNGTRDKIGHRLQDGGYVTFSLFADGQTAASETLIGPPDPFSNNFERKLLRKQRWHEKNHQLAYRSVLLDDGTRAADTFDENAFPLMEKHIGLHGVFGTTIRLFHAGTRQTLLESQTNIRATNVIVRRLDGTVRLTERLAPDEIDLTYFDEKGITPLFEQSWFLVGAPDASGTSDDVLPTEEGDSAFSKKKPTLHLWKITELNPDGRPKRILAFRDGILRTETWNNVTIDGIVYESAVINYNTDATVETTELDTGNKSEGNKSGIRGQMSGKRKIDGLPAMALVRTVPAAELVEPDLHYALPIPPEPRPDREDH